MLRVAPCWIRYTREGRHLVCIVHKHHITPSTLNKCYLLYSCSSIQRYSTICHRESESSLETDIAVRASDVDGEGTRRANPRLRGYIPNAIDVVSDRGNCQLFGSGTNLRSRLVRGNRTLELPPACKYTSSIPLNTLGGSPAFAGKPK